MKKKLNIDVGRSISDFKSFAKEIQTKNKIYKTLFRGKGPIFEGFRTYAADEDAGDIDWISSARANKLLVKEYSEERSLNFVFVVDVSDSMVFGSGKKLKCEYAGEVIAVLSNLIIESGDKIGLLLFNGKSGEYLPPISKKEQLNHIVDILSNPNNYGGKSNLDAACDFIEENFGRKTNVIIFVSDFLHVNKEIDKQLRLIAAQYETLAIMIRDRLDKTLPNINREIRIEDPNTSHQIVINPEIARKKYERFAAEQENMIKSTLKKSKIDVIELMTDKPFSVPLVEFLKERIAMKGVNIL